MQPFFSCQEKRDNHAVGKRHLPTIYMKIPSFADFGGKLKHAKKIRFKKLIVKQKMIEIRPLNKDDHLDDLISLSREFFREYETHHKYFFMIDNLKDENVVDYFSDFCGSESRKAFIALDGERIVGYITVYVKDQADYWQIKKVGDISGLMVQREYRHRGIANRLLAKAKEFFESKSLKYYLVFTATENREGLDFYRQNGLVPLYTTMIGEL